MRRFRRGIIWWLRFRKAMVKVANLTLTALKVIWRALKTPFPGMNSLTRWGLYPPLVIFISTYWCWKLFDFLPGYCIAALAFSALFMTVRADKAQNFSVAERFVWVCLGALLLLGEIRVLHIDRQKNNQEQASERDQSQKRFQRTLDSFTPVLEAQIKSNQLETKNLYKVEEAINTETGGDAFCYVDFDKPGPRLGTSSPDVISWVTVHKVGRYPLYGTRFLIVDNEKANYLLHRLPSPPSIEQQMTIADTNVQVGNVGTEITSVGGYEVAPSESHDFQVVISSFHSFSWTEYFSMRKVDGKWKSAMFIDVSGTHPKSRGYYRVDEGFPLREDGSPNVNWWPSQKRKRSWLSKLP
jgi:hypothetical protein